MRKAQRKAPLLALANEQMAAWPTDGGCAARWQSERAAAGVRRKAAETREA